MTIHKYRAGLAVAAIAALCACSEQGGSKAAAPTEAAEKAAGGETIAAGLGEATKFQAAAKAAGLDATLAGPGPYTVLVPTDGAFDKLPGGTLDGLMKPEARQELTGVLTYHVLPGAMLIEDIGKAIDQGGGKTLLPTMGGGTLVATREGDAIMVADGAGTKARLGADEKRSNGVIHRIDAVMMPS